MRTYFSNEKMIGVRYMRKILEAFAIIDYNTSEPAWKHKLQLIHVYIFNTLSILISSAHLLSTVTRSIRYVPEFCQVLLDDFLILTVFFIRLVFRARRKQLKLLIDNMENSFSTADRGIIEKCHQKQYITCLVFFTINCTGVVSGFLEVFLPISDVEYAILQYVYRTKHPERRLPFNLRFPYIDESEYWTYVFLYAFEACMTLNYIIWSSACVALVPTLIIHLCGQYEILAMYVEKIGTQHRDQWDNLIFYTNIKNNEYVTFKPKKRMNRMKPKARVQYDKHLYDKHYLRQIIQFHREIVEFKKRVCNLFELS